MEWIMKIKCVFPGCINFARDGSNYCGGCEFDERSDNQIAEDMELASDAQDWDTASDIQGDRIAMFRAEY
jgi:hypothetical protein